MNGYTYAVQNGGRAGSLLGHRGNGAYVCQRRLPSGAKLAPIASGGPPLPHERQKRRDDAEQASDHDESSRQENQYDLEQIRFKRRNALRQATFRVVSLHSDTRLSSSTQS